MLLHTFEHARESGMINTVLHINMLKLMYVKQPEWEQVELEDEPMEPEDKTVEPEDKQELMDELELMGKLELVGES
jgi:hypothetical protein